MNVVWHQATAPHRDAMFLALQGEEISQIQSRGKMGARKKWAIAKAGACDLNVMEGRI